jgi:hypothetical protein
MRRQRAIVLVIAALVALGCVSYWLHYEVWLAAQVFKREGGIGGLLKPREHVYVIGQLRVPNAARIYPFLDSGNLRNAVPVHSNGCFILRVPGAQGAFGVLAPGFKPTAASLNAGFNRLDLSLVEISSASESSVSIRPITLLQYLKGMRACQRSN